MWALSYIGANFALILVVVLAVVALGAIAWFAKNWKVAVAAALVLLAGLAYQHIDKTAYQRAIAEQKAREVAVLQARIDALDEANRNNAKRALEDAQRIKTLQEQAKQTPANTADCLDENAAGRVGGIR